MRRPIFKSPPRPVKYTLTSRPRVTKRLHMELDENGGLVIVAPRHWSKVHVSEILAQNVSRVERFLATARKRQLKPLLYTEGELHLYLGQGYPLVIDPGYSQKNSVGFNGVEFRVCTKRNDTESIRKALQGWYLRQAQKVFCARLQEIAAGADWVGDRPITLKLRRMKRTWGNCSSSGVIKLNTHLIKAPLSILDSVIAHELCHLEEMSHGRAFYALLERLNPGWRDDRHRLQLEGNRFLL